MALTRADALRLVVDVDAKQAKAELDSFAQKTEGTAARMKASTEKAVKPFKDLRGAMLNVGVATAAITAAFVAIDKFATRAQEIQGVTRSFDVLTKRVGESSDAIVNKMRPASRGMISDLRLMQQANTAIILGLPVTADSMGELTDAAVKLGSAMGVTADRALESLIVGIGRQSKLWLDNIGIVVDAEAAYKAMAEKLGVTVEKLSDADKKLAFYNATVEAAKIASEGLRIKTDNLSTAWVTLKTDIDNATDALIRFIDEGFGKIFEVQAQLAEESGKPGSRGLEKWLYALLGNVPLPGGGTINLLDIRSGALSTPSDQQPTGRSLGTPTVAAPTDSPASIGAEFNIDAYLEDLNNLVQAAENVQKTRDRLREVREALYGPATEPEGTGSIAGDGPDTSGFTVGIPMFDAITTGAPAASEALDRLREAQERHAEQSREWADAVDNMNMRAETSKAAFDLMAQGLANVAAAHIAAALAGDSANASFGAVLKSLAQTAIAQALYHTALAIAASTGAFGKAIYGSAAEHARAAIVFGTAGVALGVASRAAGGSGSGGGGGGGGSSSSVSSTGSPAATNRPQDVTVIIEGQGVIFAKPDELARIVAEAIEQQRSRAGV